MKSEFTGTIVQDYIYSEKYTELTGKNTHGNVCEENIHDFLEAFVGRNVKITVETLDEPEEDMVTVTYKEIFHRCSGDIIMALGVSNYYLNEGGDPTAIKDIPKSQARMFMSSEEFEGRCHSSVNA